MLFICLFKCDLSEKLLSIYENCIKRSHASFWYVLSSVVLKKSLCHIYHNCVEHFHEHSWYDCSNCPFLERVCDTCHKYINLMFALGMSFQLHICRIAFFTFVLYIFMYNLDMFTQGMIWWKVLVTLVTIVSNIFIYIFDMSFQMWIPEKFLLHLSHLYWISFVLNGYSFAEFFFWLSTKSTF